MVGPPWESFGLTLQNGLEPETKYVMGLWENILVYSKGTQK